MILKFLKMRSLAPSLIKPGNIIVKKDGEARTGSGSFFLLRRGLGAGTVGRFVNSNRYYIFVTSYLCEVDDAT